jgi:multiple sugar transport system substrate-binding protein
MKKIFIGAAGLVLLLASGWATGQGDAGKASLAGEVTYWQSYPEVNSVYTEYAKQYMTDHPEAKITLTLFTARAFDDKVNTAMPAGTGGDILEGWDGQLWPYITAGLIVKLPDSMLDYYHKTIMKTLQNEGKIYGIPTFVGLKYLFWNKTWFKKAGLDRAPKTITEMMEYSRKLTIYDNAGNPVKAGLAFRLSGGGYGLAEKWWMKTLGPMGGTPIQVTGEGKWASNFDTKQTADAVQYYLDALYKYKVDAPGIERDIAGFAKEQSAMVQKEAQAIPFLADNAPNMDYGIAPLPGDKYWGTLAVIIGAYVNSKCKNQALAWDVVKYFNTPDRQRDQFLKTGWNPVRGDVDYEPVYKEKPRYRGLMDFPAGYGVYFYPANNSWAEIWAKAGEWLTKVYTRQDLANDRAALEKECKAFSDQVNKILQDNNEYAPKK